MAPKTFLCPRSIYIHILAEIIAAFPWRRSVSGPCGVTIADGESMPEHHCRAYLGGHSPQRHICVTNRSDTGVNTLRKYFSIAASSSGYMVTLFELGAHDELVKLGKTVIWSLLERATLQPLAPAQIAQPSS